ncbi:LacI family DNA-binding transcriptional regulator [Arthrobacter sp. NEB 688]|uniref:LacI family DNA-binding transcriptional regulator n=1 Tax=Arthrobacter sp. NEB 688 TaxID=904039 RepID=UPI0015643944|nr:LacI family DNA-binding transcriptional regulator [Arthrobacter sp. NEB 688]QKE82776.1 LacI family DNA-binding transcriptional regulator [Arthrobacter sp. NEB 688]
MPRKVDARAKVTIVEIARLAGVGVGTASRALSNAKDVAPATRDRVLRVAEELNYVVSPEASRLAKGTRGRVAVVVPHLSRWFFGEVVEGLVRVLHAADLDVLLYHVADTAERRDFFTRLPARRKVDAVVVVGFQVDAAEQAQLATMGVHIVAAGGQSATYPSVHIDDHTAARQAVDHLLFLGHRRIGMLEAYDPEQPTLPPTRSPAYVEALRERDLPVDPELVLAASWSGENGAALMGRLLSLPDPPTAVFAHSDEVALGAVRTLRRSGLRPGVDVSVIGIDGHPLGELTDLTTVRQDPAAQGAVAGEMVVDLLGGRSLAEESVIAPTELVVRSSTGRPAEVLTRST